MVFANPLSLNRVSLNLLLLDLLSPAEAPMALAIRAVSFGTRAKSREMP